jgi:Uncharacterized protein conserved in bacteria
MLENSSKPNRGNTKILIISISIIIASAILSFALVNRNIADEQINVTGLGEKNFQSDLIVWNGTYSRTGKTLKETYEKLNNDQVIVKDFLARKGIAINEIVYSSISIQQEFEDREDKDRNRIQVFKDYRLQQNTKIESKDIERVEKVSREITELINSGIEFYSQEPQYYFTELGDLKLQLIELATKNGKERAEKIVEQTGFKLGKLKYANLGVFQIMAQNSNTDYSWSGAFDTGSKNKTATITVKMQFGIR